MIALYVLAVLGIAALLCYGIAYPDGFARPAAAPKPAPKPAPKRKVRLRPSR